MGVMVRHALMSDVPGMVEALLRDADQKSTLNPALWVVRKDAAAQVEAALTFTLDAQTQPVRQRWIVAKAGGAIVGLVHSMRLPVPPIYAGRWGDPGLLLGDSLIVPDAPAGTAEALITAAEADLRDAGARLLLAAAVAGHDWLSGFAGHRYAALTLYLGKSGFTSAPNHNGVRPAEASDLAAIVRLSSENRHTLAEIDEFWTAHPDADARFGTWMKRSLGLADRDMLVDADANGLGGYVIAQPAAQLHFPTAHDITKTVVVDDCYHQQFANVSAVSKAQRAQRLLRWAEGAFARRGIRAALVVCPAKWPSKIAVLRDMGYETAMVWMIKR
ncbi:hypothetical protein [Tabrizicola sp.]|uniref:hypothetical protein n=1 Tax=Tabrizicola sp. TaxID=2005166 RepID=UPI00286ADC5F|nr:hypothetical protein [Tabrizicola sp.]